MNFLMCLLLAVTTPAGVTDTVREHVDMIELNHFHDCLGRHVYDQVIFYEWSAEFGRYHVRAWCLIEDRELISRRPTRTYSDNRYHVRWYDRDQNLSRKLSSEHFKETWTQVDNERLNKQFLDERLRTSLIRRKLAPAVPVEEEITEVVPFP